MDQGILDQFPYLLQNSRDSSEVTVPDESQAKKDRKIELLETYLGAFNAKNIDVGKQSKPCHRRVVRGRMVGLDRRRGRSSQPQC